MDPGEVRGKKEDSNPEQVRRPSAKSEAEQHSAPRCADPGETGYHVNCASCLARAVSFAFDMLLLAAASKALGREAVVPTVEIP